MAMKNEFSTIRGYHLQANQNKINYLVTFFFSTRNSFGFH